MSDAAIADLLRRTAGLDAGALGRGVLDRAVHRRVKQLHLTSEQQYSAQLSRSPDELQHLVDDVVVHETSFFRDPGAFTALASWVRDTWLRSAPTRALNVLSLPCSTGEEPCSIVMTLIEVDPSLRFRVDAIDISTRALRNARAGEYGEGSFRGKQLDYRARYFQPSPKGWRISHDVRDRIEYRHGNLLNESLTERLYDVVFCRNLLIYFDAESQLRGMEQLAKLVQIGGLLFLGPAETFLSANMPFRSLGSPMTFGFVRTDGTAGAAEPTPRANRASRSASASTPPRGSSSAPRNAPKPAAAAASKRAAAKASAKPTSKIAPTNEAGRNAAAEMLTKAEQLANAGKLTEAADLCREIIAQQGATAPALFLLGMVNDAQGNTAEAVSWFRKTLYVEPGHEQALLHLSIIAQQSGGTDRATHLNRRARRAGSDTSGKDSA